MHRLARAPPARCGRLRSLGVQPDVRVHLAAGAVAARVADALDGAVVAAPPVADGCFALTLSRAHFWRDAMTLVELPDLADDPRRESAAYRRAHARLMRPAERRARRRVF